MQRSKHTLTICFTFASWANLIIHILPENLTNTFPKLLERKNRNNNVYVLYLQYRNILYIIAKITLDGFRHIPKSLHCASNVLNHHCIVLKTLPISRTNTLYHVVAMI